MKSYKLFVLLVSVVCLPYLAGAQSQYNGKPRYEIVATQNNATLGIVNLELYQNIAPYHVRNFDSLVSKKFYDTTAFHRVVPGFVIQGGDQNSRSGPVSTWGFGQPGQPTVKAEFSVARHERGVLSAARSNNINSATSQFFICVAAAPNLNNNYSVYGKVTSGMNVVDMIVNSPTVTGTQRPVSKIEMFVRFIGVNDTVPQSAALVRPRNDSSSVDTMIVTLQWSSVRDAVIYHVDIARDSLFTDTVKSVDLVALSYNATFLQRNTRYFWRIKVNNGGFFSYSEVRHFTTKAAKAAEPVTTGISTNAGGNMPVEVFPNPSKDKFIFSHVLPGQTLQVFDGSGKQIRTIQIDATEVQLNLTGAAQGFYSYTLSEGSHVVTQGQLVLSN